MKVYLMKFVIDEEDKTFKFNSMDHIRDIDDEY